MAQGASLQPEFCVFPGYSKWLPIAGRRGKKHASVHRQGETPLEQMNATILLSPVQTVAAPTAAADITNQL